MHVPCSACRRAIPVHHFVRKRDIHGGAYARARCPHCGKGHVRRGRGFLDTLRNIKNAVTPYVQAAAPLVGHLLPSVQRIVTARSPLAGAALGGLTKLAGLGMRRRRRTGRSFLAAGYGVRHRRRRITGHGFLSDTLGAFGLGMRKPRPHRRRSAHAMTGRGQAKPMNHRVTLRSLIRDKMQGY